MFCPLNDQSILVSPFRLNYINWPWKGCVDVVKFLLVIECNVTMFFLDISHYFPFCRCHERITWKQISTMSKMNKISLDWHRWIRRCMKYCNRQFAVLPKGRLELLSCSLEQNFRDNFCHINRFQRSAWCFEPTLGPFHNCPTPVWVLYISSLTNYKTMLIHWSLEYYIFGYYIYSLKNICVTSFSEYLA